MDSDIYCRQGSKSADMRRGVYMAYPKGIPLVELNRGCLSEMFWVS